MKACPKGPGAIARNFVIRRIEADWVARGVSVSEDRGVVGFAMDPRDPSTARVPLIATPDAAPHSEHDWRPRVPP